MKKFTLKSIVIKNFRSIIDETFFFPDSPGLKLLSGDNTSEPRLEANGAGKSSFLDAIFWCLYGTSVKGSRTSSIVSWGKDKVEVILEIVIDGIQNLVVRTGPPSKVFINDVPSTQEDIDKLIGLTKQRFLHSVLFGQGIPLFPDLSVPERGQLLDDVLQLSIWQRCTDNANKKYVALEKNVESEKKSLSFLEGKLSSLPTENDLESEVTAWETQRQNDIDTMVPMVKQWYTDQRTKIDRVRANVLSWDSERTVVIAGYYDDDKKNKENILKAAERRDRKSVV